MEDYIERMLGESCAVKRSAVRECGTELLKSVSLICETISSGGKLFVCGNGGSACDSLHICGEFVNRLSMERRPLPAIALTGDIASITAISNDYSFDRIFEKQVEASGKKGDILWVLTTSGNSKNILFAAAKARDLGLKVLAFSGGDGGKIREHSDIFITVSGSGSCPRIQETHVFLYHVIIELVERSLFGTG